MGKPAISRLYDYSVALLAVGGVALLIGLVTFFSSIGAYNGGAGVTIASLLLAVAAIAGFAGLIARGLWLHAQVIIEQADD